MGKVIDASWMNKEYRSGLPPNGGNMEARVAKLEASVSHVERDIADIKSDIREIRNNMRDDFRILFGAIITASLGLAVIIAKGFKWF